MDKENILIPITKDIMIDGCTYQISKLTLGQTLKLSKLIFRTIIVNNTKLKVLTKTTKNSTSNTEDLLAILDLLDEKDIVELFSILLKKKITSIDLDASLELIAIVCELNDFDKVKKKFQRILNGLKIKEETN